MGAKKETSPLLSKESTNAGQGDYTFSLILLAGIGMIASLEYSIVMPSLWPYMESLGGTPHLYGIILGSFEFTTLIFKPIVGYIADRRPMKEVYAFTLLLGVLGNLLYGVAQALGLWAIIAGRLLGGIGAANFSLMFGYVAKTVPAAERTKVLARLGSVRMVGLSLGPVFTVMFVNCNFHLFGPVRFDAMTAPGLFTACLLALCAFLTSFLREPPPVEEQSTDKSGAPRQKPSFWNMIGRPAVILCVLTMLAQNTNATVGETIIVPLTSAAFGWGPVQNSLIYTGLAVIIIVGSTLVSFLAAVLTDRQLIGIGLAVGLAGNLMVQFFFAWDMSQEAFLITLGAMFATIPFVSSPIRSLFSKLVQKENQASAAFYQGFLEGAASSGAVVGPIWVGATLGEPQKHGPAAHLTCSLSLALYVLGLAFFVLVYRSIGGELDDDDEVSDEENRLPSSTGRKSTKAELEQELRRRQSSGGFALYPMSRTPTGLTPAQFHFDEATAMDDLTADRSKSVRESLIRRGSGRL